MGVVVELQAFPEVLPVRLLVVDPDSSSQRFPVEHPYVEMVWLPVIGPSATWALRFLARRAAWHYPEDDLVITLADLGAAIGLGHGIGAHSAVQRTLRRLVQFRLADMTDSLEVAMSVPVLNERQRAHLSPALALIHDRMTEGDGRHDRA